MDTKAQKHFRGMVNPREAFVNAWYWVKQGYRMSGDVSCILVAGKPDATKCGRPTKAERPRVMLLRFRYAGPFYWWVYRIARHLPQQLHCLL